MKNMMAKRLKLPSYYLVESWGKQQVLNWLRSFELDDCIPAFESREIDGPALLELTEEKLFTFQDIKIKRRVQLTRCVNECKTQATQAKEQLTKCVNECKSQAMQAKEFVNSIRKPSQCKVKTRNVQAEEDNDFDCWDDFDDDDEEEEEGEFDLEHNSELPRKTTLPELTNYSSTPEPTMQNSELCSQVLSAELNSGSSQYADNIQINNSKPEISEKKFQSSVMPVNKTLDKPSLPKPPATLPSVKTNQRAYMPRSAPIRRPPSQPPPPPVPQFQHSVSIQEDYEIPISSTLVVTPVVSSVSQTSLPPSSIVNKTPSPPLPQVESQETYEVVRPPEEEYEIVSDMPNISTSSPIPVRPVLPPRVSGSQPTNPPPLPEKPRKFQDVSPVPVLNSRKDSSVSNDRQPLQKKIYDESSSSVLAGLLSSLSEVKQKSTASVKPEQCNSDSLLPSPSRVPKTSTVDKGEISPTSSLHSSKDKLTTDGTNQFPSHPVPAVTSQEDGGVINRPLPPVPSEVPQNIPLPEYSWFHDMSRETAEEMLKQSEDGKFVVRPSKRAGEGNPYTLTLSHEGKIFHLNIRLRSDGTYALGKEKSREKTFGSVSELIEFHQKEPILISSKGEPAGKSVLRTSVDKQ